MKHRDILLNESFCKVSQEAHTKPFPPPWTRHSMHGRDRPALQGCHEGRAFLWPQVGSAGRPAACRIRGTEFSFHLNYVNLGSSQHFYIIFPLRRDHSSVSTFLHRLINFCISSFSWSVKVKANRDLLIIQPLSHWSCRLNTTRVVTVKTLCSSNYPHRFLKIKRSPHLLTRLPHWPFCSFCKPDLWDSVRLVL